MYVIFLRYVQLLTLMW